MATCSKSLAEETCVEKCDSLGCGYSGLHCDNSPQQLVRLSTFICVHGWSIPLYVDYCEGVMLGRGGSVGEGGASLGERVHSHLIVFYTIFKSIVHKEI